MASQVVYVAPAVAMVGLVYSSVGLGGGTMYLALLTLSGIPILVVPSIVLTMNTVTASVGWWNFRREGYFSWRLALPLVVTSIPMAFLGGMLRPGEGFLALLMAILLLAAAGRMLLPAGRTTTSPPSRNVWLLGPLIGALLGTVSGLVGIGGGIFLAPLLLQLGWAGHKEAAGITSAFVALNSASGLLAQSSRSLVNPDLILFLAVPALLGGFLGSYLGSKKIRVSLLRKILAVILVTASISLMVKML